MSDDRTIDADDVVPGRRRRTVPAGAFVIAVMVAVALGVLAVAALTMSDGGDGDGDSEVRVAAARFTERFLTYEHDALDDWKADVLELSTQGFAEEVEDVESGLRTLIAESELDAVTQVTDVFVGDEDRGGVEVVVVYDRDLTGGELGRSESDRYVQLSMLRIEGEWLVDNVLDIATATGPGATGDVPDVAPTTEPSTTSPTSAPASEDG